MHHQPDANEKCQPREHLQDDSYRLLEPDKVTESQSAIIRILRKEEQHCCEHENHGELAEKVAVPSAHFEGTLEYAVIEL